MQYYGENLNYERRFLYADHQGSIIAHSNYMGSVINRLTYDAYGIPGSNNIDRFGYIGQFWFKEPGLFHYKARKYSPKLGRFLQTDPIGYEDQMNLYAYVGNDPVNNLDPTGKNTVAGAAIGCAATGPACPAGAAVGAVVGTVAMVAVAAVAVNNASNAANSELNDNAESAADSAGEASADAPESGDNTNPYAGPVSEPVIAVDKNGNGIPVETGEQVVGSKDGEYQQVLGADGKPTGVRLDRGGHRGQKDPRARDPHAHQPGVTTPDGNHHLPIY